MRVGRLGLKGFIGALSCVFGLVIVYFGFGIGTESPKKEASASANSASVDQRQRPVRAMNLALGNMVFLAHDLGFSVRNDKDHATDGSKVAVRIENQLQGLRELYRQEVARNPTLAGGMTLQFNVAPSGEVSQIREFSSRLFDTDFKRAIFAEVSNWSFAEIVEENLTVSCPLLFVHEGMDITTLVRWEKSLGKMTDSPALVRATDASLMTRQAKSAATAATVKSAASVAPEKRGSSVEVSPVGKEFQLKYATALRKYANFNADSLTTLTIGTKVTAVGKQGEWLEVQSANKGPTGFIRKEFVVPVEVVRK